MDLLIPTLAEPLAPSKLERFMANDDYCAEVKVDGERLLVHVDNGNVIPVNRKGAVTTLPSREISNAFATLTTGTWAFDGEIVNYKFHVWDMPIAGTAITPDQPYEKRRAVLEAFMSRWEMGDGIKLLPSYCGEDEKRALLQRVRDHNGEGIMLKALDARYHSGKRTDKILKVKLWASCDVIVLAVGRDDKSNAVIGMIDPGKGVMEVGTVSTLGRWATIVHPGAVLEVRYLYSVNPDAPKLYQPNIMRVRDGDKLPEECTIDQLKFTNKAVIL